MKLERFREKNNKMIGVVLFTIICILLIGSVILYKTFASFEVNHNFNIINGEIENSGDIYFAFYVDNNIQKEMPQKGSGVIFDKENSFCGVLGQKDSNVILDFNEDLWNVTISGLKDNHTKCNLFFKKTYHDNMLFDLSGNGYDGTFMGGALVQNDEDGNLGIFFDGEDDYVDILDLPDTINWADGFTVEFEAKWISFKQWARIFDFGGGQSSDNIFVANPSEGQLDAGVYYMNDADNKNELYVDNAISYGKKLKFTAIFSKTSNGMSETMYRDGKVIATEEFIDDTFIKNVERTYNYLGRSNWAIDKYFHGYIYSLKITEASGKVILWYHF